MQVASRKFVAKGCVEVQLTILERGQRFFAAVLSKTNLGKIFAKPQDPIIGNSFIFRGFVIILRASLIPHKVNE